MKLNLLPTYVTKGKATRTAVIVSILLFLICVGLAIGMSVTAQARLTADKGVEEQMRPRAQAVVDTYDYANQVVNDPKVTQVMRNTALAQAMIAHNAKYPNFYNRFLRYIPPFFRLTSIQATAVSGGDSPSSTVTMTGILKSYQQYADLMLALLRYPDAVSVGRAGYLSTDPFVPPLTADNQSGRAFKPGEPQLPTDPLERLRVLSSQSFSPPGYTGQGGFGSGTTGPRGVSPGYSQITVTMTVKNNLQVPDIVGTMSQSGGGSAAAPAAGGFAGFSGPGGGPGGPPGFGGPPGMGGPPGFGGPPGMPPGAMPPGMGGAGAPAGRGE